MRLDDIRKEVKRYENSHFSAISALNDGKRLGLTYHFLDNRKAVDLRATFDEKQVVPSIADIFPSASLYETEAHEMFGVKFDKLERSKLFLSDDWKKKPPLRE